MIKDKINHEVFGEIYFQDNYNDEDITSIQARYLSFQEI